jgi:hypothetical protein
MMEFEHVSLAETDPKDEQSILSSSLLDEITCAICLDIYDEPKRTSCLHVACRRCLEEYHHSCKNDMDIATCTVSIDSCRSLTTHAYYHSGPQCRAPSIHLPHGDASSLPPAIDKEQLIKLYRHEQEIHSEYIGKIQYQ